MVMGGVLAAEVMDDRLFHLLVVREAGLSEAGSGKAVLDLLGQEVFSLPMTVREAELLEAGLGLLVVPYLLVGLG